MKTKSFYFLFYVLLLTGLGIGLIRCNDTNFQEEAFDSVNRQSFIGLSGKARIELYDKLSSEKKLNLWYSKLDQVLTQQISDQQKIAILDLKNRLNTELFEKINGDSDLFGNEILMDWISLFGDKFTEVEGKKIFADLSDFSPIPNQELNIERTFKDLLYKEAVSERQRSNTSKERTTEYDCECNCTCRWGSYCSSIGDCRSEDDDVICINRRGCGFIWLNTCNGLCGEEVLEPVNPGGGY